jgi:hypothetical protein
MLTLRRPLASLAVTAVFVACSGASNSDLLGFNLLPDGGIAPPAGDASATDEGSATRDGSPSGDARILPPPPPGDASIPPYDASVVDTGLPPPPPVLFRCGTDGDGGPSILCNPGTVCCANQGDPLIPMSTTYSCAANTSACMNTGSGYAPIGCHDVSDCGGVGTCCGTFTGTVYTSVQCSPTCPTNDDAGPDQYIRFCNPNDPNACADLGLTCGQSGVLTGFYRCA